MTKGVKEKASFISQKDISFGYKFYYFNNFYIAKDGATLKSNGSHSASAKATISAIGLTLLFYVAFSLININEHAPSFNFDAFAPVIVPFFYLSGNTGFKEVTFSLFNFLGSSSKFIKPTLGTSTATIYCLKKLFFSAVKYLS